ncbi:MAG: pilus assembly protein N-terminal domain-containing protein [Myxococcaceae bacterium]
MTRTLAAALFCLSALASVAARAWPVDVYFDAQVDVPKFHRLSHVEWVEVEDPQVAEAEILPSGELMIVGRAKGRTLLLLFADGRFAVWRIRVGTPPLHDETAQKDVRTHCPQAKMTLAQVEDASLTTSVAAGACHGALLRLFQSDAFRAKSLDLTFDIALLQNQLVSIQQALKAVSPKPPATRYVGAGLLLEGRVPASAKSRVLWALFKNSVGRVALEDRVVWEPESASP